MKAGLLLLSGGAGHRMGAPKHALDHPDGGSWGGHLVRVFEAVFPGAPVLVLGDPLPDRPALPRLDDPRQGPAVALRTWASAEIPEADRWWIVACDQVRWTPERLLAWVERAQAADPAGRHWVVAQQDSHIQPLGGWFPAALRPELLTTTSRSLLGLVEGLPHVLLPSDGPEWQDVDSPEERRAFDDEG